MSGALRESYFHSLAGADRGRSPAKSRSPRRETCTHLGQRRGRRESSISLVARAPWQRTRFREAAD